MNDNRTLDRERVEVQEEPVSIMRMLNETQEMLFETDALLTMIIGGINGENKKETELNDETCCIRDDVKLISSQVFNIRKKAAIIKDNLL